MIRTGRASPDNLSVSKALDDNGRPTSYLAFKILKLLFSPPFPPTRPELTAHEVAALLATNCQNVELILQQLEQDKLLTKTTTHPNRYQYNLHCPDVERQANLEKFLLEAELKNLPVHRMLP